jgi:hypothetical protein
MASRLDKTVQRGQGFLKLLECQARRLWPSFPFRLVLLKLSNISMQRRSGEAKENFHLTVAYELPPESDLCEWTRDSLQEV